MFAMVIFSFSVCPWKHRNRSMCGSVADKTSACGLVRHCGQFWLLITTKTVREIYISQRGSNSFSSWLIAQRKCQTFLSSPSVLCHHTLNLCGFWTGHTKPAVWGSFSDSLPEKWYMTMVLNCIWNCSQAGKMTYVMQIIGRNKPSWTQQIVVVNQV